METASITVLERENELLEDELITLLYKRAPLQKAQAKAIELKGKLRESHRKRDRAHCSAHHRGRVRYHPHSASSSGM